MRAPFKGSLFECDVWPAFYTKFDAVDLQSISAELLQLSWP
jgi:hypothetical protein